MKNGSCPKCGGKDIRKNDSELDHGSIGTAGFTMVTCVVYVCAACGYLEDYVESPSLEKIRKSWDRV